MSSPVSDKTLNALYQQRKQQLQAPDIELSKSLKSPQRENNRVLKISTILGISCLASFSIFALIVHFAKPKVTATAPETLLVQRAPAAIEQAARLKPSELAIGKNIAMTKPDRPVTPVAPSLANAQPSPVNLEPQLSMTDMAKVSIDPLITIAQLTEQSIDIQLAFKVLPVYPVAARKSKQQGSIVLSYKVNMAGAVTDIKVLKASPKRVFDKSARRALRQWKYAIGAVDNKTLDNARYEIEFVYKLDSKTRP